MLCAYMRLELEDRGEFLDFKIEAALFFFSKVNKKN